MYFIFTSFLDTIYPNNGHYKEKEILILDSIIYKFFIENISNTRFIIVSLLGKNIVKNLLKNMPNLKKLLDTYQIEILICTRESIFTQIASYLNMQKSRYNCIFLVGSEEVVNLNTSFKRRKTFLFVKNPSLYNLIYQWHALMLNYKNHLNSESKSFHFYINNRAPQYLDYMYKELGISSEASCSTPLPPRAKPRFSSCDSPGPNPIQYPFRLGQGILPSSAPS
jgi:hypothetical protein